MLPYTIRPELTPRPNKKGLCPIRIVITVKGRRSVVSIGERVRPDQWTGSEVSRSHPAYKAINAKIRSEMLRIETDLRDRQLRGEPLNLRAVTGRDQTVFSYFSRLMGELEGKYRESTLQNYRNEYNRLQAYDPSVTFSGVSHGWLRRYEQHLRSLGLAENTLHKVWKILRKVFNSAIADKVTDNYPFRGYDNPRYRQTDRTHLSLSEVDRMHALLSRPLSDHQRTVLLYFLLGCYSGLRLSDWLRFNHQGFIQGDRLITRAKKNGELVSLPMHNRLAEVVDHLKDTGPCPSEGKVNECLKVLASMAGVTKLVTSHVARHSFAVRCAELGISIETTSELMGITVKSCGYYYKVTNRKIDAEVEKWNKL